MDYSDMLYDWQKPMFKQGRGEEIPYDDETFEVVICYNVLDHVENVDVVLKEMCRTMKKDEYLILMVHVLKSSYKFLRLILDKVDSPHPHHFTEDDLRQYLSRYFHVKSRTIEERIVHLSTIDLLKEGKINTC